MHSTIPSRGTVSPGLYVCAIATSLAAVGGLQSAAGSTLRERVFGSNAEGRDRSAGPISQICEKCAIFARMSDLLTVGEAAEEAGVAPSTIYRWIQGGVLSLRYFNDGRQAIVKEELANTAQRGENAALVELFSDVAAKLGQAVALLPAVQHMFGAGWEDHAWGTEEWNEMRIRALKQAEAHRDVAPFIRRRGRPAVNRLRQPRSIRP